MHRPVNGYWGWVRRHPSSKGEASSMWDFSKADARYNHHHEISGRASFLRRGLAHQGLPVGAYRHDPLAVDDHQLSLVLLHLGRLTRPTEILEGFLLILSQRVLVHKDVAHPYPRAEPALAPGPCLVYVGVYKL